MGGTPSVATTSAAVRSSTRNWRPARPWKRRAVEKSKSGLSHRAWKSRKVRGIPTFPPPRRLREINPKPDISLATKSGRFNLLTTDGVAEAVPGQRTASEIKNKEAEMHIRALQKPLKDQYRN